MNGKILISRFYAAGEDRREINKFTGSGDRFFEGDTGARVFG
jgi:hypothetical protein